MAKGRNPDRKYIGPPGYWGFSVGLRTPPSKSTTVTETQMEHQTYTSYLVGRSSLCERMASRRQSQQHRIPTRLILLSPKQPTVIAAGNVRTMYEQGKASMVVMTSRKWTWIGHTLRRPNYCIARQALPWNPQGSRRRGRPRNRWRRDTDHTIQSRGLSWQQLERLSRDRGGLEGLCQWPMFRDGMIQGFRSDQKRRFAHFAAIPIYNLSSAFFFSNQPQNIYLL